MPNIHVHNHSNLGKDWEAELENVHHWYRLERAADVVKNPSEWVFIGQREYEDILRKISLKQLAPGKVAATDNGRFMKLVPSDIDFSGGGRGFTIAFDAKATAGDRLPLDNIKPHQIRRLLESSRCGCVAGFLVLFREHLRVFFVAVDFVDRKFELRERSRPGRRRAAAGTASLSISELEAAAVEIFRHPKNGLWDYLSRIVK